jgi:hypothetical protein
LSRLVRKARIVGKEKHEGAAFEKVLELNQPDFVVKCEPNDSDLGIGQKGELAYGWMSLVSPPIHQPHT